MLYRIDEKFINSIKHLGSQCLKLAEITPPYKKGEKHQNEYYGQVNASRNL